jgi:hypothetical protein
MRVAKDNSCDVCQRFELEVTLYALSVSIEFQQKNFVYNANPLAVAA